MIKSMQQCNSFSTPNKPNDNIAHSCLKFALKFLSAQNILLSSIQLPENILIFLHYHSLVAKYFYDLFSVMPKVFEKKSKFTWNWNIFDLCD